MKIQRYLSVVLTGVLAIMLLMIWPASNAVAQMKLQGLSVLDKKTKLPLSGTNVPFSTVQMEAFTSRDNQSLDSMLNNAGIETNSSMLQAVRKFNPEAFEGSRQRPGTFLYVPVPKFSSPDAASKYSVKYSDFDLSRLQLKNDAASVLNLKGQVEQLAAKGGPALTGHVELLQKMAGDLNKLGDLYSTQISAPELATISLQKEVAEYLTTSSMTADTKKQIQNYHQLKEATDFVSNTTFAASANDPNRRRGRKITIHYAYIPGKKPLPGKQLYFIPLGMQPISRNFPVALLRRFLEGGRFIGPTSPSSRTLPVGNFSIVAGPLAITDAFLDRLVNKPETLDMTTVVIPRDDDRELEMYLPVRNPP